MELLAIAAAAFFLPPLGRADPNGFHQRLNLEQLRVKDKFGTCWDRPGGVLTAK